MDFTQFSSAWTMHPIEKVSLQRWKDTVPLPKQKCQYNRGQNTQLKVKNGNKFVFKHLKQKYSR